MKIRSFDTSQDVLVIAEIGNNHEGDIDVARQLVHRAAECGAGAVKFQTYRTELFVAPHDELRFQRMKSFELSHDDYRELHALAKSLDLLFISTPLDVHSAAFLAELVDCYKIASGDNNFFPLIEAVCATGKPLVISTGVSGLAHVANVASFVEKCWQARGIDGQLAVLHCVSNYPVEPRDANLSAIRVLRERLSCEIGYSDHTLGIDACLAAVALGARIVEKHFTLDTNYSDFRDHHLAADPCELTQLVEKINRVGLMLGNGKKTVIPAEVDMELQIRRSIVASTNLQDGHVLSLGDLTWLRPGKGLPPGQEAQLLGRCLKRSVRMGEPIQLADVA